MTTDEPESFVALVDQLIETYVEDDWEGIEKFAQGRDDLEYVAAMPFSNILLPPSNPEDALPIGFEMRDLRASFESIDENKASGGDSKIIVPEGLTLPELMEFWQAIRLFLDSGARAWRGIQSQISFFREWGVDDAFVVLDEDHRVVEGLAECWAMAEVDGYETIRVVVLKDAPQDAGLIYSRHVGARKYQNTWSIEERRDTFEGASPEAQDIARSMGWTFHRNTVTLTCSSKTLDRLGLLIRKQLGGTTKHDPAQLLYVETLREAILDLRNRLIKEGRTEGDVVEKRERHLAEEREMMERGAKIEARKGWRWQVDEDGLLTHPAVPRYRFKIVDDETRPHSVGNVNTAISPFIMPVSQFQILARTHFGLDPDEAAGVYEAGSPEDFNRRLKRYIQRVPEVAPKVKGAPSTAERERQKERLALWVEG